LVAPLRRAGRGHVAVEDLTRMRRGEVHLRLRQNKACSKDSEATKELGRRVLHK